MLLCGGDRDAEVVEEVLHADAEGLVVSVDAGPGGGFAAPGSCGCRPGSPRPGQALRSAPPSCRPFFGINHPIPGSDSQGNSDFRKITRNLSLTFATFGDTGQGGLSRPIQGGGVECAGLYSAK
jgi:hypothetical protein